MNGIKLAAQSYLSSPLPGWRSPAEKEHAVYLAGRGQEASEGFLKIPFLLQESPAPQ